MTATTTRPRMLRALLAVLVGSVLLTGCDFDVYKLPLPGGTDVGSDPITVTVMFTDVLDLVPKSTVKVNDVNVGKISDIDLEGYTAKVTLELRNDTRLPDNALAEIRQTSLLGEKFVSLSAPADGASSNPLSTGDVIPLDRSGRNPEIEEVLGALSLVLNGGGVAQLKTISQELDKALTGREDSARSVLTQIDTLSASLDSSKGDIITAIESLNRLSLAASKQLPTIDKALAELPAALTSIDAQRADLVRMLSALDSLSDVAVGVIQKSKDSTIRTVQQLQPVLTQLADSGDDFVNALNTFYAYPFVDEVVGRDPQVARNLHVGDYTNLDVKLDVDLSGILPTALPTSLPIDVLTAVNQCLATLPTSLDGLSQAQLTEECRSIIGNGLLEEQCSKPPLKGTIVCTLPGLPKLPTSLPTKIPVSIPPVTLPPLPLGSTGASPGPSTGVLGGVLGGLTGLGRGSSGRAGTGWAAPSSDGKGGPTVAQLQQVYDPDLVTLMIPGMVGNP